MSEHATGINLYDPEVVQCPLEHFRALLASGQRVTEDPNVGVVAVAYDEVMEASMNPRDFSSEPPAKPFRNMGVSREPVQEDVQAVLDRLPELDNVLFIADPPAHTRQRKLMNQALNARRVRQLEPQVQSTVDELVDGFIDDGQVDFGQAFAVMLPLRVISDILGVRHEDMRVFRHWGDLMMSGFYQDLDREGRLEVAQALVDFHEYFEPLIEERRREPREDLLSWMVNAEVEGEPALRNAEVKTMASQILLAGHETTTHMLGNAGVLLAQRSDLQDRLRATPEDIPKFIEEVVRWSSPITATIRRVTRDVEFHGRRAAENTGLALLWGGANHDPDVFPQPETFDMDRPNVSKHLGFGHGIHFCVGRELARLEGRLGFATLLRRTSRIELDEEHSDLSRLPAFGQHGYQKIVLRLVKA